MQAATQIHFFFCELLVSNVGHPFAGIAGVVGGLFCAASGWAHLSHTASCCVITPKGKRERIEILKSEEVVPDSGLSYFSVA